MTAMKKLNKLFSRIYDDSVEVSEQGVLHVDAGRLLTKASVKRQLEAARRIQQTAPTRTRKTG